MTIDYQKASESNKSQIIADVNREATNSLNLFKHKNSEYANLLKETQDIYIEQRKQEVSQNVKIDMNKVRKDFEEMRKIVEYKKIIKDLTDEINGFDTIFSSGKISKQDNSKLQSFLAKNRLEPFKILYNKNIESIKSEEKTAILKDFDYIYARIEKLNILYSNINKDPKHFEDYLASYRMDVNTIIALYSGQEMPKNHESVQVVDAPATTETPKQFAGNPQNLETTQNPKDPNIVQVSTSQGNIPKKQETAENIDYDSNIKILEDSKNLPWKRFVYKNEVLDGKKFNKNVIALQNALNELIGVNLEIDGQFGSETYKAVMEYQKTKNLQVDGQPGQKTISAILEDLKAKVSENPTPTTNTQNAVNPENPVSPSLTVAENGNPTNQNV